MGEEHNQVDSSTAHDSPPSPPPSQPSNSSKPPSFDPTRMVGIIRRKALIKNLAAAYHAECLTCCQELLELQRKSEEPFVIAKIPEDAKKEVARPTKRVKKSTR